MSNRICFDVNGKPATFEGDPLARLLDVLRVHLGLTGTKEGCGEGECGSCSVLLDGEVVCACLVPIAQVQGRAVTTIEGVGAETRAPLQQAFIDEGAVQCGACTPGMIIAAVALLAKHKKPTEAQAREHLAGNICRCTGYHAIFRAIDKVAGQTP